MTSLTSGPNLLISVISTLSLNRIFDPFALVEIRQIPNILHFSSEKKILWPGDNRTNEKMNDMWHHKIWYDDRCCSMTITADTQTHTPLHCHITSCFKKSQKGIELHYNDTLPSKQATTSVTGTLLCLLGLGRGFMSPFNLYLKLIYISSTSCCFYFYFFYGYAWKLKHFLF